MLPRTFWLVLNYHCNNRCKYCYISPTSFPKDSEMPLSSAHQYMQIMKEAEAKSMILIGGEPTLHSRLRDIIEYGAQYGFSVGIVTNGRRFSDKRFVKDVIDAGLKSVVVSFEAADRCRFNKITQVARSWDQTVAAIKALSKETVGLCTITTVSSLTVDSIEEIARTVNDLGVRRISFNFATPNFPEDPNTPDYSIDPKSAAQAIEDAYWTLSKEGIKINFLPTLPMCLFSSELRDRLFPLHRMGCACHVYTGSGAVFDPNQKLLQCTHLTEFPTVSNLETDDGFQHSDFQEFWEDPHGSPGQLRKSVWRYPSDKCKLCDYWGRCIGGCPIFRKKYQPTKFITEPITNQNSTQNQGG